MIDSYRFGCMVVDGRQFTSDLKIFPDGSVAAQWWRQEGHRLIRKDIQDIIDNDPELLIIGTGASGLMKVAKELVDFLSEAGLESIILQTEKAGKEYNRLAGIKNAAACFHLTC